MDEFLTAAIVGTAQYKNALPLTHSAVDTLAAQLPSDQKERAFLLAAGARAIYLQAGHQASTMLEPPVPAEPETLQPCSERVSNLITDLFMASNDPLLPEALQRLHAAQLRIPHAILVACLTYGTQHKDSRADMIAVLGERARWLGQFNPDWNWINDERLAQSNVFLADAETIWQEGTVKQRQEILQRLRAHDPEKARAWLEAVWKKEKAETRVIFLPCLQEGISSDDQAFIEQALEDRSEGVREIAVSLLHFTPAAPQIQKALTAISAMIDYKNNSLRQKFTIKLPEQVDLAWKNTISIIKVRQDDNNDARYWLGHAFSRISPLHWEEQFASSPKELVNILSKVSLGTTLLPSLIQAALLHHATNWYPSLIEWYIAQMMSPGVSSVMNDECQEMLTALPQSKQEELIAPLQTEPKYWNRAITFLSAPWSITFSHDYIQMLKDRSQPEDSIGYSFWSNVLPIVARALHPSCFELAQELDNPTLDDKTSWNLQHKYQQITAFKALIQLRLRILEEI